VRIGPTWVTTCHASTVDTVTWYYTAIVFAYTWFTVSKIYAHTVATGNFPSTVVVRYSTFPTSWEHLNFVIVEFVGVIQTLV
jgi:hypothetical protein